MVHNKYQTRKGFDQVTLCVNDQREPEPSVTPEDVQV